MFAVANKQIHNSAGRRLEITIEMHNCIKRKRMPCPFELDVIDCDNGNFHPPFILTERRRES